MLRPANSTSSHFFFVIEGTYYNQVEEKLTIRNWSSNMTEYFILANRSEDVLGLKRHLHDRNITETEIENVLLQFLLIIVPTAYSDPLLINSFKDASLF